MGTGETKKESEKDSPFVGKDISQKREAQKTKMGGKREEEMAMAVGKT